MVDGLLSLFRKQEEESLKMALEMSRQETVQEEESPDDNNENTEEDLLGNDCVHF